MEDKNLLIKEEYLFNLDLNDPFFDSLRKDYLNFDLWFLKKARDGYKCFVSYYENDRIASLLILKLEDELEDYSMFSLPFPKQKKIKISTLKVDNRGKQIGNLYLKKIIETAIKEKLSLVYITLYPKQYELIKFLQKYDFYEYGIKTTSINGIEQKELVYIKNMKNYLKDDCFLNNKKLILKK